MQENEIIDLTKPTPTLKKPSAIPRGKENLKISKTRNDAIPKGPMKAKRLPLGFLSNNVPSDKTFNSSDPKFSSSSHNKGPLNPSTKRRSNSVSVVEEKSYLPIDVKKVTRRPSSVSDEQIISLDHEMDDAVFIDGTAHLHFQINQKCSPKIHFLGTKGADIKMPKAMPVVGSLLDADLRVLKKPAALKSTLVKKLSSRSRRSGAFALKGPQALRVE